MRKTPSEPLSDAAKAVPDLMKKNANFARALELLLADPEEMDRFLKETDTRRAARASR